MKKIIILIVFIMFLGGCFDYTEIEDLSIITGMIIDYKNNNINITFQILENDNKSKQYTTTCNNIDECIYKISEYSNKEIFISHLKTIILTENTIINDINFYDYFLREPKSKMNFHLYYIDNKDKDNLIKLLNNNEALYLKDMTSFNHKLYSSSIELYFLDYMQKRIDYGITPIIPSISINDNKLYLDKLVAFNKNHKKIELDNNEGIFYNIIMNNINKTLILIPCDKNNYSLEIDYSNTKFYLEDDIFNINTTIKGSISSYNCDYKLDSKENIDKISNITNKYIKDNIDNIIKISKDNNTDFIGLSSFIYKHTKKKTNIKRINTNINVNTIIESLGEIKNEY